MPDLPGPARRVVALTCSNTEIVAALGCADRLVAVDDHSDHPPEVVARLPRVGPDLGIHIDRVAALEPDLVLASLTVPGHEKVVARLEAAGLPFIAPAPESLADVARDIRTIGRLLGVEERAEELARSFEAAIPKPTGEVDPGPGRPKLLIQWWPKPVIAPGAVSWAQDLLRAAGAVNALAEPLASRPLTDEEVRDLAPDAVVLSWCGVEPEKIRPDVIYRNPAWQGLPFLERRHVYTIPEAFLGRPGPRLVEGYEALRRVVGRVAL